MLANAQKLSGRGFLHTGKVRVGPKHFLFWSKKTGPML